MGDSYLEAGKIVNTHGVRGEVRIIPWADSPDYLAGIKRLYIDDKPFRVLSARTHKSFVLVALEGVDDIDSAIRLKNKIVHIHRDDAKLEEGRHFVVDLIGLQAIDAENGSLIGNVVDFMTLPGNDVYVIQGEREILIPAVDDFVVEINTGSGYIRFRMIEGL